MKINKLELKQFGGLKDKNLNFSDNLNLIIGDNEAGKSTIVDLIFELLFKNDERIKATDDFKDKYYPNTVGTSGDFIKGAIELSSEDGNYFLQKTWDDKRNLTAIMGLPSGQQIMSLEEIKKNLNNLLSYQKGVYREVVFMSQKMNNEMLNLLFSSDIKSLNGVKGEIKDAIFTMANDFGGVESDEIKRRLDEVLENYSKHWDYSKNIPENGASRGIENPWKITKDKDGNPKDSYILQAYYDKEEVKQNYLMAKKNIERLEEAKNSLSNLNSYKAKLKNLALSEKYEKLQKELKDKLEDKNKWPSLEKDLKKAQTLANERDLAVIRDLYVKLKRLVDQKEALDKNKPIKVESFNITNLERLLDEEKEILNELKSLNADLTFKKLPNNALVTITSVATGKKLEKTNEKYDISEAINVKIGNEIEFNLCAKGVDEVACLANLGECKEQINRIFADFKVNSKEELREKEIEYSDYILKANKLDNEIKTSLQSENYDSFVALAKDFSKVPADLEDTKTIGEKLREFSSEGVLFDSYVAIMKNELARLQGVYKDKETLDSLIFKLEENIKASKPEIIVDKSEVPDAYQDEAFLDAEISKFNQTLGKFENEISKNKTLDELENEGIEKREILDKKIKEYENYLDIKIKFDKLKEEIKSNPLDGFYELFSKYLSIISDKRLQIQNIDEKLSANITSNDNLLTSFTLSEGTKDSINLAFRLSMLELLFKDKHGLAIFDDPFTDMDEKRVKASCKLIEEFAKKHQVIFLSCDNKYEKLMKGNKISI